MFPFERLNSWLHRRVLNHQYPESRIVETYCLSEWAHFMQLTGQLPHKSITDILGEPDDDITETIPGCKDITLSSEQLTQLCSHYRQVFEEYDDLWKWYENDTSHTQSQRRIPMSEWVMCNNSLLTDLQQMCQQLSSKCIATQIKHKGYDCHHRSIMFSSADADREISHTRNSFVSLRNAGVIKVGRIMSIFRHKFVSTVFASVYWFDGPFIDKDSKLNFVFATVESETVIPINDLSRPHVVAIDEEPQKVWILNL